MMKTQSESLLDHLYLASPCSVSWESMVGSERQRNCGGCSKTVFNISDMTRGEAEAFLLENGSSQCMRFYRRTDGTIMTDNCPRALRKIRDKCKLAARIAVGLVAFMVSLPSALAQSIQTGDSAVVKENLQKIAAPDTVAPASSMRGRALPMPLLGKPIMSPVTPTPVAPTTSSTTASVEARIVTKKHTLPNGKKVLLVTPGADGKVVRVNQCKKVDATPHQNGFIDKRAAELYAQAQKAKADKRLDLAEFLLEKTIEVYDTQKGGDTGFRQKVENELKAM
jgi:hypothetical protein